AVPFFDSAFVVVKGNSTGGSGKAQLTVAQVTFGTNWSWPLTSRWAPPGPDGSPGPVVPPQAGPCPEAWKIGVSYGGPPLQAMLPLLPDANNFRQKKPAPPQMSPKIMTSSVSRSGAIPSPLRAPIAIFRVIGGSVSLIGTQPACAPQI